MSLTEGPVISEWVLLCLTLVVYLAIAVVAVRKYIRTRDRGFVWLVIAVVLWPLINNVINKYENSVLTRVFRGGHAPTFFPFSLSSSQQMTTGTLIYLLTSIQSLVGISLVLVAILQLYKRNAAAKAPISGRAEINL
jgi:hypothetical protein